MLVQSNSMSSLSAKSKPARGFLKSRFYPSCDFTIGANHPPKRDGRKSSATEIETISYQDGYKCVTHHELGTNQRAISDYTAEHHPGALDDDVRAKLFTDLEESGQYEKAIALVDFAASIPSSLWACQLPLTLTSPDRVAD